MTNLTLFLSALLSVHLVSDRFRCIRRGIAYDAQKKIRFDHIDTSNQTQSADRKKRGLLLGCTTTGGGWDDFIPSF